MVFWEPVRGVYWSTPPTVAVDESLSVSTLTICGVLAAFVATAMLKFISYRLRPEGWGLRKHLGAVGLAMTLAYLAIILPIIWSRLDSLLSMPLNEVGDFLAGVFGPVAFSWLILGFMQQGEELKLSTKALEMQADELRQGTQALLMQADELRNSVEQQAIMAAAATQQIDAQQAAYELQRRKQEKALLANFSLRTGSSGSGRRSGIPMNRIKVRNDGSHAYKTTLSLGSPFLDCEDLELGHIRPNVETEIEVELSPTQGPINGIALINYEDGEGNARLEKFAYTVIASRAAYNKQRE